MHVWLLALSVSVILFEPTLRARAGQFVYKDFVSMAAALTFWLGMENYIRALLVVFFLHGLLPLEVDLLEQTELLLAYSSWITLEVLPGCLILAALFGAAHLLNLALSFGQLRLVWLLCVGISLGVLLVAGVLGWDFIVAGLSSVVEWEQAEVFYLQPRTG